MKISYIILAKGQSNRLKNKNKRNFLGKPMFLWNTEKCVDLGDTYVSSDSDEILELAEKAGATGIKRPITLCGNTPNIPCYQHAYPFMGLPDVLIAVQANSPTLKIEKIVRAQQLAMREDFKELMTIHSDTSIYGSIWAMTANRLMSYPDPYNPKPNYLMIDDSVDIHDEKDLIRAQND